jgi:hypothetical protein
MYYICTIYVLPIGFFLGLCNKKIIYVGHNNVAVTKIKYFNLVMKLRFSGAVPPLPMGLRGLHIDKFTCVFPHKGFTPHYGNGFSSVLHFISCDMQCDLSIQGSSPSFINTSRCLPNFPVADSSNYICS